MNIVLSLFVLQSATTVLFACDCLPRYCYGKPLGTVVKSTNIKPNPPPRTLHHLEELDVVPNVILYPPKDIMDVRYRVGATTLRALGNNYSWPLSLVSQPPLHIQWVKEPKKIYTVLGVMLSGNTDGVHSCFYARVNIPYFDNKENNTIHKYGQLISEVPYAQSTCSFRPYIRYLFLAYVQPNVIAVDEEVVAGKTIKEAIAGAKGFPKLVVTPEFDLRQFVRKYGLGDPVAAVAFKSGFE